MTSEVIDPVARPAYDDLRKRSESMRVYQLEELGDPAGIVERDREPPTAGPHQIVVRVRASALNKRDLFILDGTYPLRAAPNVIPVSDGAGEVVAWSANDRSLDCPADLRGVPLGCSSPLPDPRSGSGIRVGVQGPRRGHGDRRGSHRPSKSLAEPLRRAGHRQHPPRVPRPRRRPQRASPPPTAQRLLRALPSLALPPLARDGLSGAAGDTGTRGRHGRGDSRGRRALPALRATRRLSWQAPRSSPALQPLSVGEVRPQICEPGPRCARALPSVVSSTALPKSDGILGTDNHHVDLAEAGGFHDQVDRDDPPARDRGAEYDTRPSSKGILWNERVAVDEFDQCAQVQLAFPGGPGPRCLRGARGAATLGGERPLSRTRPMKSRPSPCPTGRRSNCPAKEEDRHEARRICRARHRCEPRTR